MSIWTYLFDHDFFQRHDIERLKADSTYMTDKVIDTSVRSKQLDVRVRQLEDDVASLALFNQTLLRMIVEKELCTAQEFMNLLGMIDLEDGVADGRVTPQQRIDNPDCPECNRRLPRGKTRCMYCGHETG